MSKHSSFYYEPLCKMDVKNVFMVFGFFTILVLSEAGKFINIDSHRYYLSHPLKKNWFEALRYCTYHGMVLIDINDDFENDRILSIIKHPNYVDDKSPQYWTSGTDLGAEGNFVWTSSGHSVLFSDYASGQPDNAGGAENCLEIRGDFGWKWNDDGCMGRKYFICRNSVSYPFTNPNCITSLGKH